MGQRPMPRVGRFLLRFLVWTEIPFVRTVSSLNLYSSECLNVHRPLWLIAAMGFALPLAAVGDEGPTLLPPTLLPPSKTGTSQNEVGELTVIRSRKRKATESTEPDAVKDSISTPNPNPTAPPISPDEMHELIRGLVLENLPHQYDDVKNWNKSKEVVSGLNIRMERGRLKTNRRRKTVNHGTWKRYQVELLNPKQEFDFSIDNLKSPGAGEFDFRATVVTPLRVTAQLQEWSYGAKLMSISTEAESRVRLQVDCHVSFVMDGKRFPPDVVIKPKINAADIQLIEFEVKRISHIKGAVAREIGRSMRSVIEKQIAKKRDQLPAKINKKIAKKQDRLRLSLSDLLNSKWGKVFNPLGKADPSAAEVRAK